MGTSRDKDRFKARVHKWSDKLDVRVRSLSVRPMRNKWASYSTAGNLSFSDELLALDDDLTDYVIVHELLHSFVPNHGKLWKSLMRAHLGDYEVAEARLKVAATELRGKELALTTRRGPSPDPMRPARRGSSAVVRRRATVG